MMDKKFSEQYLIQLLHTATENRSDAGFNHVISFLLSTTNDLSIYSMDEAFWLVELAKVLARNHDKHGVALVQKMFTDGVLHKSYAKSLADKMREVLGYFGDQETLAWISEVEGHNDFSTLFPDPTFKVEKNRIAERLGLNLEKRLNRAELSNLLIAVKEGVRNNQLDDRLSKLVSNEYNLADFVIDKETWILLKLAETLAEKGDPRGKALLCKLCEDDVPGSSAFSEALENSIMRFGGEEARQALAAMRRKPS